MTGGFEIRLCGEFVKILPLWSPLLKGAWFFATSSFDLLASFPRTWGTVTVKIELS